MSGARLGAAVVAAMLAWAGPAAQPSVDYPAVVPGTALNFPRDHGAHRDHRLEWWYLTGWLEQDSGPPLGFQITFFRSRPLADPANPSRFAPKQILFAHAALSDPALGRLVHDQRAAREGFGFAAAETGDMRLRLLDWSLARGSDGRLRAHVPARDFTFDLRFAPTQQLMLNGEGGFSRKGPAEASYYYSLPQLRVRGTLTRRGRRSAVAGTAWLDREWSSSLLPPAAVGWDWTGINFADGSALMAFQVRSRDGRAIHSGGTFRPSGGEPVMLGPDDVRFVPRRLWRSPETGATYPVDAEFRIRLPGGVRRMPLKPLFDRQELAGGGMPSYWEGAVTTPGGRGYLELTGYAAPLTVRP